MEAKIIVTDDNDQIIAIKVLPAITLERWTQSGKANVTTFLKECLTR